MLPTVSVITPCYNQAEYLPDALESVLQQTYTNWECIIISDGSPDNVSDKAAEYIKRDKRFSFYDTQNGGPSAARNFGISRAQGEFILPLDGDDKISANYIEECVKEMIKSPGIKLVYGAGKKFGIINEVWKLKTYSWEKLLFGNMIHPCGLYRKKDWEASNGYDVNMLDGIEDWEFWINLLKENHTVIMLNDITFYHRVKDSSRTTELAKGEKEAKMKRYVFCKHAVLYEDYFIDPLKIYEKYMQLHQSYTYIEENFFRFFCSKILRKFKYLFHSK